MGGKVFERSLVHSVAVAIAAKNNFVPLLKRFIANVLKCKARLKVKFKCVSVTKYVFLSDESFLTLLYKNVNRPIKY